MKGIEKLRYPMLQYCKRAALDYIDLIKHVGVDEMADESTPQKVDLSMVAEIVASYVAQNGIGVVPLSS